MGETLTASASDIADDDGLANAAFAWQWIANDADIAGATGATYTLMSAEVGKTVKVRAIFTDDRGAEETVLSDATAAVEAAVPPAIVGGGVQVTSAPQAASDTYGSGETITLTVTFDKAVTVDTTGGMPRIQFRLGPPRTDRWAEYSGGSGNTALTFTYEVQSGDMDSNGIWLPKNKLHLRSGTIRDAATNTADAALSYARAGLQSGHKVDGSLIYTPPAGPIPTLLCHNGDSREAYGSAKFDATLEIRPGSFGFDLDAVQVTKPSAYSNYLLGVAPTGQTENRWVLRVQLLDAVTRNAVSYEDARGQFSLQVRGDSFTNSHGVYNEASNILRFAFHPLATMPDASATHGTDGRIDFTVTLDAVDDCRSVTVDWATVDGPQRGL